MILWRVQIDLVGIARSHAGHIVGGDLFVSCVDDKMAHEASMAQECVCVPQSHVRHFTHFEDFIP